MVEREIGGDAGVGARLTHVDADPSDGAAARAEVNRRFLEGQNAVLERIAENAPLHETLDALVRVIEGIAPGMLGSILLLDSDKTHVRHGAAPTLPESFIRGVDGEPIGPRAGSCGTAAYRREPVVVEDIERDPLWENYRELALRHGLRACWSTPIFNAEREVLGTFAMYFREPRLPEPYHWELIEVSTHLAAIAITADRETQALRASEAQLAEAQRIAQVGSYDWDIRNNTVRRSRELYRIFGVRPEDFAPTLEGYLDRVHPDDRERTLRTIERSMREGAPFDFEERIVRPDGSVRQLRSQGTWIHDESGAPIRLVGICQDITERKAAEERLRRNEQEIAERRRVAELLSKRNEELTAFAYTVSHDLKAPLRAIAGYARELAGHHRAELSERSLWCVQQIGGAAANLERLIEELLHYSRLDTQAPSESQVDLADVVSTILRERAATIAEHHAQVDVQLQATAVWAWERGLRRVLTNLIDNALKYSRDSRPSTIRIGSEDRGDVVRLSVSDNGIGFDMKHHDRIFGLFNRLVGQEYEGTGAGLAIAKKVVEKMNGRIWAESIAGVGSTFFVELRRTADPSLPASGGSR